MGMNWTTGSVCDRRSMHHVDTGAARQDPYVRELL